LDTGGKRLRAQVTLQLATLFSVDSENALQWASAVELLHNATLIHDDVQDGDTTRRNHPCTWVEHGIPQAINAGDLGLMLPFQCIEAMDIEDALRWRLSRILSVHSVRTVCGQSLEMTLLPNKDFSFNSYTNAALGKTGAFFALPMEGVAHLAGLSKKEREELVHLFAQIGLLFQMQDDVLDCFGNKGRMQGADLCECIDIFAQSGALQLALTEIQVLEDDIYTSEILNSYPRLKVQVEMLLDTIMTPIQHLFERPLEMSQ
jgi:geranylgeranyl diphosphate synthase type I